MRKLVLKLALLFGVLSFVLGILTVRYVSTNYWKAENNVWKFNSVPEGIQLANFGSSHGECQFKYEDFPQYTAFNFGVSGQRYFWDYGIMQQYSGNFAPGAVVMLPISYFGITSRLKDYSALRPRYYRFLEKQYFDQWSLPEAVRYKFLPVLSAGKNILRCFKDVPAESIDIFHTRTTYMDDETLMEYCQTKYEAWTNPENERGEEGYKQNLEEACLLVDFCLKNGLKPVLITAPITTILNDIYAEKSPDFFPTFYRFIEDIQDRFPSVPYFDYSHDSEFSPEFQLFLDGDHLNVDGVKKFTARVMADLQAAGLLQ